MRQIKEILHLKWELGLAARQIAHSVSISHSTVLDMLRRAERAGITWPLPTWMTRPWNRRGQLAAA